MKTETEQGSLETIDIVFDGPPSHESGRFIEVEDASRASVGVGKWIERDDGYWVLRIKVPANAVSRNAPFRPSTPYSPFTRPIQTALDFLKERRDWRHVLALMRLRFSEKEIKDFTPASMLTLVRDACRSVKIGGEKAAEALAKSFGL